MTSFKLVTIDQKFTAEQIARTGSEQLINKAMRSFVGLYNEDENWYIPLRSNLGKKKPKEVVFETPFETNNLHFKKPGLDFEKSIYVPIEYVIPIKNTLPLEQSKIIFEHQEEIKEKFEKYILSIERMDKASPGYLFSTVPLFPEGIQKIKQKYEQTIYEDKQNSVDKMIIQENSLNDFLNGKETDIKNIIQRKDLKELQEHLQRGINQYLDSENFKNYLDFVSQFHNYSFNNILLLKAQKSDITMIASFKKWNDLGRKIKKSEQALFVFAPREVYKKDADGNYIKDNNGEFIKSTYFKLVPVFDISQTSGARLPQPIYRLEENFKDPLEFKRIFESISKVSNVPIRFEEFSEESNLNGYYHHEKKEIVIRKKMSEQMIVKTLLHELVHSRIHSLDENRSQKEFEAESVAYIVANHFGIDTSNYTFGYLSSWTDEGRKIEMFTTALENITKEAQSLIRELDKSLEKSLFVSNKNQAENKFEERLFALKESKKNKISGITEFTKYFGDFEKKSQAPKWN